MPIHVRIIATYPELGGSPEETFDLTYRLRSDFASTPSGAHQRIVVPLEMGEDFAFPVEGDDFPAEFSADVLRLVRRAWRKDDPSRHCVAAKAFDAFGWVTAESVE